MNASTELDRQFKEGNDQLADKDPDMAAKLRDIYAAISKVARLSSTDQIDRIAEVIHEFEKERCYGMMDLAPMSSSDRQALAGRIFERILKEA